MFDKQTLIHKVVPPLIIQLRDERMVTNVLPALIKITEELNYLTDFIKREKNLKK